MEVLRPSSSRFVSAPLVALCLSLCFGPLGCGAADDGASAGAGGASEEEPLEIPSFEDFTTSDFDEVGGAAVQGSQLCAPEASQVFVFGDSIPFCYGVSRDSCAVSLLEEHLADSPLTNLSVGGSKTEDIVRQVERAEPESGHALVVVQVIGNDMTRYIALTDAEVEEQFPVLLEEVEDEWTQRILPALDQSFPEGYSLLISSQYNPFECSLGAVKDAYIAEATNLLIEIARSRPEITVVANSHPAWIGHGNGFEDPDCESYDPANQGWMNDLIHPNEIGHAYLGALWAAASDYLRSDCQP